MAEWGAPNDATTLNQVWLSSSGTGYAVSGESFPSNATIDSVAMYGLIYAAGAYDFRVAIYTGGTSASDIDGASLQWDSGLLDGTEVPGSAGWFTLNTTGSPSVSSGDRVWIVVKGRYSFYAYDDDTDGDLTESYFLAPFGEDENTAYPSTAGSGMTTFSAVRYLKFRLNYTASASGSTSLTGSILTNSILTNSGLVK